MTNRTARDMRIAADQLLARAEAADRLDLFEMARLSESLRDWAQEVEIDTAQPAPATVTPLRLVSSKED